MEHDIVVNVDELTSAPYRLGRRERRKLGMTIGGVRRAVKQLEADGDLDKADVSGTAAQVLGILHGKDPQAYVEAMGDRDWGAFFEALLAFLEKILPLILTFF